VVGSDAYPPSWLETLKFSHLCSQVEKLALSRKMRLRQSTRCKDSTLIKEFSQGTLDLQRQRPTPDQIFPKGLMTAGTWQVLVSLWSKSVFCENDMCQVLEKCSKNRVFFSRIHIHIPL
jgi:hypothetical protein